MTNAEIYLASARMAMARKPQHVNLYIENYKKYLSRNVVQFGTYDEQIDKCTFECTSSSKTNGRG